MVIRQQKRGFLVPKKTLDLRQGKELAFRLVGTLNVKLKTGDKERKRECPASSWLTLSHMAALCNFPTPQLPIKRGLQMIKDSVDRNSRHLHIPPPAAHYSCPEPFALAGIITIWHIKKMKSGKVRIAFLKTVQKNCCWVQGCTSFSTVPMSASYIQFLGLNPFRPFPACP